MIVQPVSDFQARRGHRPHGPLPRAKILPASQQGFSMIEMIIAMALGLVVTGAVLYTVSGSALSGRKQEVQSSIHDSGQMALTQLVEHLRMTGFWVPPSEVLSVDVSQDEPSPIRGCNGSFADAGADWNSLACASSGGTEKNDSLALRFQVQSLGRNWDCLGKSFISQQSFDKANEAALQKDPSKPFKTGTDVLVSDWIDERYYVKNTARGPALYCHSGVAGAETLISENVDQFRVLYGVSPVNAVATNTNAAFDLPSLSGRSGRYRTAPQLEGQGHGCSPGSVQENSWCTVSSVQVCLLLRSENNVNESAGTPYVDCDGQVHTANDRRLRQVFRMTVALRNKIAP